MRAGKTAWVAFLAAATACLAAGLALSGVWFGALAALIPAGVWIYSRRKGLEWLAAAGLAVYLGLAAFGLVSGAARLLVLAGSVAALAAWDLTLFTMETQDGDAAFLERAHLRALLPVVAAGLTLVTVGSVVRIRLPFGWLLLLAVGVLVGLSLVQRYLKAGR